MASVLGRISAKTRISTVITAVAAATPQAPGITLAKTELASSVARMLKMLFPNSTAPIIISRSLSRRLTRRAARSPSRSSWCMRARLAPVIAVSAAENSAEAASRAKTIGASAISAAIRRPFRREECGDRRGVDVLGDEGLAERHG